MTKDRTSDPSEIKVKFWENSRGGKPAEEWLNSLDDQSARQMDKLIKMLKMQGRNLTMPHCRNLKDGLWELRDKRSSGPGYRLYYTWQGEVLVLLLGGGNKFSQENDIKIAKQIINNRD